MRPIVVAVVATLVASCGEGPVTQVMVVIDADDVVRAEIGAVRIEVFGGAEAIPMTPASRGPVVEQAVGPRGAWPITHAIVPLDDDSSRRFRVDATALRASGDASGFITVRAISGFVEGRTMALRLRFHATCRDVACDIAETCTSDGECGSAVDPPLDTWNGVDGGVTPRDAGPDGAAGDSGGGDAGGPTDGGPDAGPVDAGPPPTPTTGWSIGVTAGCGPAAPIATGVSANAEGAIAAVARGCGITAVGGMAVMSSASSPGDLIFAVAPDATPSWAVGFNSLSTFVFDDVHVDDATVWVAGAWQYDEPDDYFGLPYAATSRAFAAHLSLAAAAGRGDDVTMDGVATTVALAGTTVFVGGGGGAGAAIQTSRATSVTLLGDGVSTTRDLTPSSATSAWAVGSLRAAGFVTAGDDELYPEDLDGFVIEVAASGEPVRGTLLGGPGPDHVYAVATTSGRLYVGGALDEGAVVGGAAVDGRSAFVASLDAATLTVLDTVVFPSPALNPFPISALAVRADGAVFAGGFSGTTGWTVDGAAVSGWVVVRLEPDLDVVWHLGIPAAASVPPTEQMDLALLPDGSVVAAGAFAGDVVLQQIVEEP